MVAHLVALATLLPLLASAAPSVKRTVDTMYPYKGPAVPVGDPVNPTAIDNGKGFPRLYEHPAVEPPAGSEPSNNINVISSAYFPGGINIHFQTPFGIGSSPQVKWGSTPRKLSNTASGYTHTYDRTPPCSMMPVTQCSQFFHEVQINGLQPGQTYFYQIPGGNGTSPSEVLSFTTALAAGDETEFTVAVVADLGYTNAKGTHLQMLDAISTDTTFVWHGGDICKFDPHGVS